jgi:hypothetical protein
MIAASVEDDEFEACIGGGGGSGGAFFISFSTAANASRASERLPESSASISESIYEFPWAFPD